MVRRVTAARFLRDERGSAKIKFILWAPVFAVLLMASADAAVLYRSHTELRKVCHVIAQRLAAGDITEAEVTENVTNALSRHGCSCAVGTSVGTDVVVEITTDVGDASLFGLFKPVLHPQLRVRAVMPRPPV